MPEKTDGPLGIVPVVSESAPWGVNEPAADLEAEEARAASREEGEPETSAEVPPSERELAREDVEQERRAEGEGMTGD
jgi:hypothetical protein